MNSMNKTVQTRGFHCIFTGLLYSFIIMGIISIIVSFLLLLTNLKEGSLSIYIYLIHGISLVIGGFFTGKRIEHRGWYYGGIMGIIYSIIILLVGFLSFNTSVNLTSLITVFLAFAMGALGGIIGVNSRK